MIQREIVVDLVKAAFVALIVKVVASNSILIPWNSVLDNLCVIFAVCVTFVKICRLTFPLNKVAVLGALSMLCLYSCIRTGLNDLMVTVVVIVLLIGEDPEEYIGLMLKIQAAIVIGHIAVSGVLSLLGRADDFWLQTGSRLRFNGGMSHSNVLSCFILSCMLMFAWLRFGRITPNEFGWMFCITVLSFLLSRTRTGLLLNLFLLLLLYLTQNVPQLVQKILDPVLKLIFPALSALIYWSQTHYSSGNRAIMLLDDLLTGRIKYAAYAYTQSGVTWLPRYLDYADSGTVSWTEQWGLNTFTFDNVYSFLFMQMGTIWIVVITVLFLVITKKCSFRNKVFFLFWTLYAMVEIHGMNCLKFFPLLLLCTLFSDKQPGEPSI